MADAHPLEEHRCSECGEDLDVDLPARMVEECHEGKLLLFVGSGASTESHNVMPDTFYDTVAAECGDVPDDLPFPDLMTRFVSQQSRGELINLFYDRKAYIDSFPSLVRRATRFHWAVAQIPFFREIVTTNWDDYFEVVTGAVPLVVGADFDYWDLQQRKVLKVHGSTLNPGSIVATRSEYDASLEALRNGALGSATRHLVATQSVVFVGYSLRDEDIRNVIDVLRADLGTAARRCYFVHPNPDFVAPIDNAEVVRTSAARFIELLDDALVASGYLLPADIYERRDRLSERLRDARRRSDSQILPGKHPMALYNHSFQDGFSDALGRVLAKRRTGIDRAHGVLAHTAAGYFEATKFARKARNYWDEAYMEGYGVAMAAIDQADFPLRSVPVYFCPGLGPTANFSEAAGWIKAGAASHRPAFRWAEKQASNLNGLFAIHTPFLPPYG
jgi:hypothetical protein